MVWLEFENVFSDISWIFNEIKRENETLFYTISPLKVSSTEDCNSALTEYKMKHDVAMYQQINNDNPG